MDPVSLSLSVVHVAALIYDQVQLVRGNETLWSEIATLIRQAVDTVQGLGTLPSHANFVTALSNMHKKLFEIHCFLQDVARKKFLDRFFRASKHRERLLEYRQSIFEYSLTLTTALQAQNLMDAQRDRQFAIQQAEVQHQRALNQESLLRQQQEDARKQAEIERQRALYQEALLREQQENMRRQAEDLRRIEELLRDQEAVRRQSPDSEMLLRTQMESAARCLDVSRPYCTMPKGVSEIPLYSVVCEEKIQTSRVGDVYRGKWDQKPVFVKVIFDKVSERERQHFSREMEVLATLQHPNIVRMYGGSIEENSMCIVTEQTSFLTDVFERYQSDLEQRMRIARDLLAGLRYMHSKQVMHANIKPEEVGIGCYGEAQWVDLSWAKTDILSLHSIGGSQEANLWQAPEVRGNRSEVTPASDVYSFGWMIWTLYMGRLPFSDRQNFNWTQCLRLNTQENIPEDCPYADIIRRAWSMDPCQRPSLEDMARALDRPASLSGEEYFMRAKTLEVQGGYRQAEPYYQLSAEKGYYKAMTRLGVFYLGEGERPSLEYVIKAKKYFEDAIALGDHHLAYYNLGRMYEKEWIPSGNAVLDALDAYRAAQAKAEADTKTHALYSQKVTKLFASVRASEPLSLPQIRR